MATNTTFAVLLSAVVLALAGCSEAPTPAAAVEPKKEAPAPPEAVSAKTAFYKMYKPVREWAPDLMTMTLVPEDIPEVKSEGGKFGKWIAVFVSPSKRQVRTVYFASADSGGNTHKGVTMTPPETFGAGGPNRLFANSDFSIDSDAAYQTGYAKAKAWVDKHPDKKVSMLLSEPNRYSSPVWYMIWGDRKLGFDSMVNASSGELMNGK